MLIWMSIVLSNPFIILCVFLGCEISKKLICFPVYDELGFVRVIRRHNSAHVSSCPGPTVLICISTLASSAPTPQPPTLISFSPSSPSVAPFTTVPAPVPASIIANETGWLNSTDAYRLARSPAVAAPHHSPEVLEGIIVLSGLQRRNFSGFRQPDCLTQSR